MLVQSRMEAKYDAKYDVVVLLSGGIDSSTLLYYLKANGYHPKALTLLYGQKHSREVRAASMIAEEAHTDHDIVDISGIRPLIESGSLVGDEELPREHYSHESQKSTIVPNRNAILLSIAVGHAIKLNVNEVAYAAHSNDRAIYPDCRKEFVDAFESAMRLANDRPSFGIFAPFIDWTKADIVGEGIDLGVPFNLTWTCYRGTAPACGKCSTCQERLEAFDINGIKDPIGYEVV